MGVSESILKAMKGVQGKLRSDLKSHTEYTDLVGKILKSSFISIFITFDKSLSQLNIKCV